MPMSSPQMTRMLGCLSAIASFPFLIVDRSTRGLRQTREEMAQDGLIHAQSGFPPSWTLITAILLLMLGLFAISSMVFSCGPFG